MNRCFFLVLVLLLTSSPVFSQIEVTGTVYDADTGESLPAATILLEDTYRGTVTNEEGKFSIIVDELPVTLQVRYIGYETAGVQISDLSSLPLKIRLNVSVTELEELIVTEKDPGLTIMERVIARKQIWRKNLHAYQAEAYTRQVLSNDTSIVSISESSSIVYWDEERGHREIQVSKRQTSNMSEDQNFAGVNYQPNFYDDNIEIAGYNIVGITHPEAPKFYIFGLQEIQQMDGKPVYKISVSPRRERQPTFIGTAWVLGRDYALLEVNLVPNDVVTFPPPIQEFNLSYQQQFSNYGRDFWLPVDMRVEGTVRVGMVGLRFPPFLFKQSSRISDYEINVELPDSIFQQERVLTIADSTIINAREGEIEAIPLTSEENLAYQTIDSTRTFEEAFKPEGFLARMVEDQDESNDNNSGFFDSVTGWLPDDLGVRARYNRMDGVHAGLSFEPRFESIGMNISTYGGYSFHSEQWDMGVTLNQKIVDFDSGKIAVHAGYDNMTDSRFESLFYSFGLNSFQTLLGAEDYFDYFRNEKIYTGISFDNMIENTELRLRANREFHTSFDKVPVMDYSLFGWHKARRKNPMIQEGTLHSISLEFALNKTGNDFGFTGGNQLIFSAEHSSSAIGSDFDFTRMGIQVDLRINTFYQRRLFANTLDISFTGGTAFGDLPVQRLGIVDVGISGFVPFGVIKTRQFVPYAGSSYWTAYAEHNFRTIPFEFLGLEYFVEKGWGIILYGGAGYAEAKNRDPYDLLVSDGIHSEIGASINNIFGIARLDFSKRLDAPGFFIGFSVPRYF